MCGRRGQWAESPPPIVNPQVLPLSAVGPGPSADPQGQSSPSWSEEVSTGLTNSSEAGGGRQLASPSWTRTSHALLQRCTPPPPPPPPPTGRAPIHMSLPPWSSLEPPSLVRTAGSGTGPLRRAAAGEENVSARWGIAGAAPLTPTWRCHEVELNGRVTVPWGWPSNAADRGARGKAQTPQPPPPRPLWLRVSAPVFVRSHRPRP